MLTALAKARFANEAARLLVEEGRPLSIVEMLELANSAWGQAAKYELTVELRSDRRFTYMGRRMFSYAGSGLTRCPSLEAETCVRISWPQPN